MSAGIPITIFDTYVRVPNGNGSFKNIAIDDFIEEVKRMKTQGARETPGTAFRFPNEVLSAEVSSNTCNMLLYFPEAMRTVKYQPRDTRRSVEYEIPFPATIIRIMMKTDANRRWIVENVRWYATDMTMDEIPNIKGLDMTPSNRIYPLPFPNQYGDGRMCTGANSYRSLYEHDLRGLNELYHGVLVASPFNDDLGVKINVSLGPRAWFERLSKLKEFPYKYCNGYTGRSTVELPPSDNDDDEEED